MTNISILATIITLLHVAQSYILLTANVDDVHTLAQQLISSPVVDELHRIWRRASQQFQQQLRRPARQRGRSESGELNGRRSNIDDDLVAWGKNASIYLKAFRRMLDNV